MVWDVLHHHCHDPAGMSDREAIRAALATWPRDLTPKIHYSSPRLDVEARKLRRGRRVERQIVLPQLRAHADLVDPIGFERFLLDVMGRPRLSDSNAHLRPAALPLDVPSSTDPHALAEWWLEATLDRRRALLTALVDEVRVAPATKPGVIDMTRISVVWRQESD